MHVQFLKYFVDPTTREPLRLEHESQSGDIIESGYLVSSTNRYPIIRGVPRFVESINYSKSFGWQWKEWPRVQFEAENIGKPMEGHTRRMWERIVGYHECSLDLAGQAIVDIGCGPGRFIDIARSRGAKVIGLDYSNAVEVAHENFIHDPDVCIIQANALQMPIKSGSVDGAYTIGVLHHTPDPEAGVKEAYRVLASGKWFSICVYGKGGYYDFPTVQAWRRLFNLLGQFMGHTPPLIYTYFTVYLFRPIARLFPTLGKAIRLVFPFVNLPDKNWSLLDTFDSITPSYQSAHESYEVFSWLKRSGFHEIEPTNWGFTSFSCVKNTSGESLIQT